MPPLTKLQVTTNYLGMHFSKVNYYAVIVELCTSLSLMLIRYSIGTEQFFLFPVVCSQLLGSTSNTNAAQNRDVFVTILVSFSSPFRCFH